MSNLKLIVLVLVSSKFAFVVSEIKTCHGSDECNDNECCYDGVCTDSSSYMCYLKGYRTCSYNDQCLIGCCVNGRCGECSCSADRECTDGCCVNLKCKQSWQCYHRKETCTSNEDCDSRCCKNFRCQNEDMCQTETCYEDGDCDSGCCKDYSCQTWHDCHTTAMPTVKTRKSCYYDYDCYDYFYGSQCCRNGQCQYCEQKVTTESQDNNNDYDGYDDDDYSDPTDTSSRSSHSSLGAGGVIGVILGVLLLVILKVALWVYWCSRRERVVVVRRRRVRCVAVPIVVNDELQREHERAAQRIPDCPPPAYSPRPFQDHTQNVSVSQDREDHGISRGRSIGPPPVYSPRGNTDSHHTLSAGVNGNRSDMNGVSQEPTTIPPPPPYSSSSEVSQSQNASLPQTDQTQRETRSGNPDEINGSTQANTPTAISSHFPVADQARNATGQNSAQVNPSQRRDGTNGDEQQEESIGPFVI